MKTRTIAVCIALTAAAAQAAPRIGIHQSAGSQVSQVARDVREEAPRNATVFRRLPSHNSTVNAQSSLDLDTRFSAPPSYQGRLMQQYDTIMQNQGQFGNPYGSNQYFWPGFRY